MQLAAIIVSLVLTVVGVALLARAIGQFVRYFKLGQPVPAGSRTDNPYARSVTLVKEFLGHTRMNRWGIVGVAHWFVAVGFLTLPPTLAQAFGQLFQADWTLPVIGTFLPFEMYIEFIGLMTILGIAVLIVIRLLSLPSRPAASPASPAPRRARRTSSSTSSSPSASRSTSCGASRARCTTSTATSRRTSRRTRWCWPSRA
jgi:hypothetical protein